MEAGKRTRISDNQRDILERFYDRGMVGVGLNYREKIDSAVVETGLRTTQVKKWISNQRRKRPVDSCKNAGEDAGADIEAQSRTLKKAKSVRGPSAYNLFCAELFKRDKCKNLTWNQKNQLASAVWKLADEEEKESLKSSSVDLKTVKISSLSEEQKGKLILRHRKKLLEEIHVLEDLGCDVSTLLQDNTGKVLYLGSQNGTSFLASHPEVGFQFREYFANGSQEYTATASDVQHLFNKKYSEAAGKPCKVPYQKGGFRVEGLPDDLQLRKPYHYGATQRKNIMLAKTNIKFILDSENPSVSTQESATCPGADNDIEPIRQLLTKIAGNNAADCALSKESPKKIEESEVEVVNLDLSQQEKVLLYSRCKGNFSEDAWMAVGKNMRHCQDEKPLILPAYTENLSSMEATTVLKTSKCCCSGRLNSYQI